MGGAAGSEAIFPVQSGPCLALDSQKYFCIARLTSMRLSKQYVTVCEIVCIVMHFLC